MKEDHLRNLDGNTSADWFQVLLVSSKDFLMSSAETALDTLVTFCCLVARRLAVAGPAGDGPNKRNPSFVYLRRSYEQTRRNGPPAVNWVQLLSTVTRFRLCRLLGGFDRRRAV